MKNLLVAGVAGMVIVLLSGCSAKFQKYQSSATESNSTIPSQKIIEREIIYKENPNIKKAVTILIQKVERLEHSGVKIKSSDNYSSRLANIEKRLRRLESKKVTSRKSSKCCSTPFYRVDSGKYIALKDVSIRGCPDHNSIAIGVIKKGTVVEFEGCNTYGWCKLKNGRGYVAGFLFKKLIAKKSSNQHSISKQHYHENNYEKIIKEYVEGSK